MHIGSGFGGVILLSALLCAPTLAAVEEGAEQPALEIPTVLTQEHEQLHRRMAELQQGGGEVARAAKRVAERLGPHFRRENEIVMPVLDLLRDLARGRAIPPEARDEAIRLSARLEADYAQMLHEHAAIVEALEALELAARDAGRPEVAQFAQELKAHAELEEAVLYPAAVLAGRQLREQRAG